MSIFALQPYTQHTRPKSVYFRVTKFSRRHSGGNEASLTGLYMFIQYVFTQNRITVEYGPIVGCRVGLHVNVTVRIPRRGVATGGISGYIPPQKKKSVYLNFYVVVLSP